VICCANAWLNLQWASGRQNSPLTRFGQSFRPRSKTSKRKSHNSLPKYSGALIGARLSDPVQVRRDFDKFKGALVGHRQTLESKLLVLDLDDKNGRKADVEWLSCGNQRNTANGPDTVEAAIAKRRVARLLLSNPDSIPNVRGCALLRA